MRMTFYVDITVKDYTFHADWVDSREIEPVTETGTHRTSMPPHPVSARDPTEPLYVYLRNDRSLVSQNSVLSSAQYHHVNSMLGRGVLPVSQAEVQAWTCAFQIFE